MYFLLFGSGFRGHQMRCKHSEFSNFSFSKNTVLALGPLHFLSVQPFCDSLKSSSAMTLFVQPNLQSIDLQTWLSCIGSLKLVSTAPHSPVEWQLLGLGLAAANSSSLWHSSAFPAGGADTAKAHAEISKHMQQVQSHTKDDFVEQSCSLFLENLTPAA